MAKMGRPPVPHEDKRVSTTFMLSRRDRSAFIAGAASAGFVNRSAAMTCLIQRSLENDGALLDELVKGQEGE